MNEAESLLQTVAVLGSPDCKVSAYYRDTAFNTKNTTVEEFYKSVLRTSLAKETCKVGNNNVYIVIVLQVHIKKTNNRTSVEDALYSMKTGHISDHLYGLRLEETELLIISQHAPVICKLGYMGKHDTTIIIQKSSFCPLVELNVSNVHYDNETVELTVQTGSPTLTVPFESILRKDDTSFCVCKDIFDKQTSHLTLLNYETKVIVIYRIYNLVCTLLSLLFLFFTIMTYTLFAELRTVPGKNNIVLSICLFFAQSGILIAENSPPSNKSLECHVLAFLLHFSWLATFCAMNTCSFHMFHIFSSLTKGLESNNRVFWKYFAYVLICPSAIIVCVVVANVISSDGMYFGYGENRCFVDNYYSMIFGVLVPAGVIVLSNIVFYTVTFYKIYEYPTLQSNREGRRNLVIYVKLCSVTGVAWPFLFIDTFSTVNVFSFFASFFNALQGMYLFLAFVLNKRIFGLYRQHLCRRKTAGSLERHEPKQTRTSSGPLNSTTGGTMENLS